VWAYEPLPLHPAVQPVIPGGHDHLPEPLGSSQVLLGRTRAERLRMPLAVASAAEAPDQVRRRPPRHSACASQSTPCPAPPCIRCEPVPDTGHDTGQNRKQREYRDAISGLKRPNVGLTSGVSCAQSRPAHRVKPQGDLGFLAFTRPPRPPWGHDGASAATTPLKWSQESSRVDRRQAMTDQGDAEQHQRHALRTNHPRHIAAA